MRVCVYRAQAPQPLDDDMVSSDYDADDYYCTVDDGESAPEDDEPVQQRPDEDDVEVVDLFGMVKPTMASIMGQALNR
jgi:hypothetical protein